MEVPTCGGGQLSYKDSGLQDGVWVEVTTEGAGPGTVSRFGFAVFKCVSGERCHEDSEDLPQPPPVRLQNILLGECGSRDDPGTPCVFPGTCGEDLPGCMECFLNGLHPYDDYRYVSFEVTVPGDFEDIESGVEVGTWGNLYIDLFNTGETLLPPGEGDYHNIGGRVELLTGDAISIARTGDNTWMVRVTVDPPMLFSEWYVGCAKPPNKNGKCPTEYKHPLDSWTSGTLTFEVTWTRIP